MTLIEKGQAAGHIVIADDGKRIRYPHCNKDYRYTDPEERVRAEVYCELIFDYGYKPARLDLEVKVPRRTPEDRADIVVYADDARQAPYIVVECKAHTATEAEFVQAIEQGFGNANSLRAPWLLVTSGVKANAYDVQNFKASERDANKIAAVPRAGQKGLSKAKFYKGGQNEKGEPAFDLKEVQQDELTRVFKQAHQSLWAGGKRNPSEAFDELDKLIFCKIWDERKPWTVGQPYQFQEYTGEAPDVLRDRIRSIYAEGQKQDPEVFKEPIRLSPFELKTVVGYLAPLNIHDTDLDAKGRAFETFLGSFFRGDFGQYFTPREVVQFIIDALPFDHTARVLDTSCGSGGFLLYALQKVREQADALAAKGAFKKGGDRHYKHWHDFASKNLFGIEISEGIARTAKMNMIIHDDGHTNVVASDGLVTPDPVRGLANNPGFRYGSFDCIVTNPPFGSAVKLTEQAYLRNYALGQKDVSWIRQLQKPQPLTPRDSQSTETLFIEQCHNYLKAGGWLAVVVPDGLLTNASSQPFRDWVEEHYRLVAVVSLPQDAFRATDAGVKSSVLFLRKNAAPQTARIKAAKEGVRTRLFRQQTYGPALKTLEAQKKAALKNWHQPGGFDAATIDWLSEANQKLGIRPEEDDAAPPLFEPPTDRKTLEATAEFKAWKSAVAADYNEQIAELETELEETAREALKAELADLDYPILMALPQAIGFDSTGRKTPGNDLVPLAQEIHRFIGAIQEGGDRFFR